MSNQAPVPAPVQSDLTAQAVKTAATSSQPPQTPQAPEVAKAEPSKEEQLISAKYQKLAQEQRRLRQMQQQIAQEKAKMEEEFKTRETKYSAEYISKAQLEQDLMGTLSKLGYDDEKIAGIILNRQQHQDPRFNHVQSEIESLKKQLTESQESIQKQMADSQNQAYEQAVNQIREEAKTLISSSQDYEAIKNLQMEEAVVELIKETFNSQNKLLSVEEAARLVEDHLIEEAMRMASLSKVKTKLAPEPEAQAVAKPTPRLQSGPYKTREATPRITQPQSPQTVKTLTNAHGASQATLSRRERAILAMKGQLNS